MNKNKKTYDDYSKSNALRICKFVHIIMTVVAYSSCLYYYNTTYNHGGVGKTRFMIFVALYAAILCFSLRTFKSYDFGFASNSKLVYSQGLADAVAGGAFYIVFVIANSTVFTPLPLIMLLVLQFFLNIIWSAAVNRAYFKFNKPKKTALIYNEEEELLGLREAYSRTQNFDVVKMIKSSEDIDGIKNKIADCEAVFAAADIPFLVRNETLKYCIDSGKVFYTSPRIGDILFGGSVHLDMFSVPVFCVSRAQPKVEYAFVKRAIDIAVSLLGIIILSPVMLITAIAIKAYDKGPALYKQVRLTKDGKEFKILKFRSMRVNAESDGVARLATDHDDRITPIGKIIRACRLDELPQLFNILKGDMTIVGPRPERPEIAKQYEEELPEFRLRLQVKAGLTGLAQIYGRYNTEPYDKLRMDLMYINQMSVVKDLRLILATVKILFMKDSTEGTAQGQITAMKSKEKETVKK